MKDSNLLTPDLHDFSDLKINVNKIAAVVGAIACLALIYSVLDPFGSAATAQAADQAAPPAATSS